MVLKTPKMIECISLLLLLHGCLFCLPLLILDFSPILRNGFVPVRLFDTASKRRASGIELISLTLLGLFHRTVCHGHVASKSFTHVHHATLALAEALLQLSALEREGVDEGLAEAVGGAVALNHDTVGFLETLRECFAQFFA